VGIIESDLLEEGEFICKFRKNRLLKNKNIICVTTGATGSGKSYSNLRQAELWYEYNFKKEFPIDNVCFSITELMKLLSSGELKKGEEIILEEAGTNVGSQDWQNKTVKMFNYLLQSFRSMNIILTMNLPVFSMLSKQPRQLVHMQINTEKIDFELNRVKVKPLMHQLNQQSGKSYWKYPRVKVRGKIRALKRLSFGLPSNRITRLYELKKKRFLLEMTNEFTEELMKIERDKMDKMSRSDLTDKQLELVKLIQEGLSVVDIALKVKKTKTSVYEMINSIKKKGYEINPRENKVIQLKRRQI